MNISIEKINALRETVRGILTPFRFAHTLGVERMAARLSQLCCPDKELLLRSVALLHDVTKEFSFEKQLRIFQKYGVQPTEEQLSVPPTIHALTAALIIPDEFPAFADIELIDAIRYHSTGRANMTLSEKIIYLSDYIEDTRKYDDCIALREEFFAAEPEKMSQNQRIAHLNRVLLHSIELTIEELTEKGKIIEQGTLRAQESLKLELEIND